MFKVFVHLLLVGLRIKAVQLLKVKILRISICSPCLNVFSFIFFYWQMRNATDQHRPGRCYALRWLVAVRAVSARPPIITVSWSQPPWAIRSPRRRMCRTNRPFPTTGVARRMPNRLHPVFWCRPVWTTWPSIRIPAARRRRPVKKADVAVRNRRNQLRPPERR